MIINTATGESWKAKVTPADGIGYGTTITTNQVDNDATGPELSDISRVDDNTVLATFNEPMTVAGVENAVNWALASSGADNGIISVSTVTDTGDATSFNIDVSQNMIVNTNYTFTVTGVQDSANTPNNINVSNNAFQYFHAAGVLNVTTDTTIGSADVSKENFEINCNAGHTLTINGTHTFAKVTLSNGCSLTHDISTTSVINKMNLTILSTLNIDSSSRINVDEKGLLGAGVGGAGTSGRTSDGAGGQQDGAGINKAGSHGGEGGHQSVGGNSNVAYDSIVSPAEPGAGGGNGGSGSGGSGGGAVIITSENLILNGSITANGGDGTTGEHGGAGGTVALTVNGTISGSGTISANGRGNATGHGGGGGRVSLKATTNTFSTFPPTNIEALGFLTGTNDFEEDGAAGTIYIEALGVDTANQGSLYLDNNTVQSATTKSDPFQQASAFTVGSGNFKEIRVVDGAEFISSVDLTASSDVIVTESTFKIDNGTLTAQNLTVSTNSFVAHQSSTSSVIKKLTLNVSGNLTIDASSTIDVNGRGFVKQDAGGKTSDGAGGQQNGLDQTGGSHGGFGGVESNGATRNAVYDNILNPTEPGGGGNDATNGGNGGGVITITAGTLNLLGTITANGANGTSTTTHYGSGAGGTVNITATTLTGDGTISANGGTDARYGGGGGRIAIKYATSSLFTVPPTNISASGGSGLSSNFRRSGAGTIYLEETDVHTTNQGVLILDNNDFDAQNRTTPIEASLLTPNTGTFSQIHVKEEAKPEFSLNVNVGTMTINDSFVPMGPDAGSNDTTLTFTQLTLENDAELSTDFSSGSTFHPLTLVGGNLIIDLTSRISVKQKGFDVSNGPGFLINVGASHGGIGANSSKAAYGDLENPITAGSGSDEEVGGGVLLITADNITNNGDIEAFGFEGTDSSAGGSINLNLTGSITGTGTVDASGGGVANDGGAGGRIALRGGTFGTFDMFTAAGGNGAENGTIFLNTHGTQFEGLSGALGADMTFTYKLFDNFAGTVANNRNLVAEFSVDGGTTFATATDGGGASEGKTGLSASASPGTSHTFVWDSAADIGVNTQAIFRLRSSLNNSNGTTLGENADVCVGAGCPVLAQITTPSSTQSDDVTINYILISSDNAPTSITVEYSDDGGNSFQAATAGSGGDGLSGLASAISGTAHTFVWDSATDLGDTDQSDIQFRILPTGGAVATTSNFRVDNNAAPVAVVTTPDSAVPSCGAITTTPVVLTYTLSDTESENANVIVEFSTNGGAGFSTATSSGGDDGLSSLGTSPAGTTHTFNWNMAADIGASFSNQVQLRVRPSDALNAIGTNGTTANFTVNNNNPVTAAVTTPASAIGNSVTIEYTLTDANNNNADIVAEFSGNDGVTFVAATESAGDPLSEGLSALTTSSGGSAHTFVWDTTNDIVNSGNVIFRITPTDSNLGACGSATFFVVKTTGSSSTPSPGQIGQVTPPTPPKLLGFEIIDGKTLKWNIIDTAINETGFVLEDNAGNIVFDTGIISVKNLTFLVETDLAPNKTYCRRVKAKNFFGNSASSEMLCAKLVLKEDGTFEALESVVEQAEKESSEEGEKSETEDGETDTSEENKEEGEETTEGESAIEGEESSEEVEEAEGEITDKEDVIPCEEITEPVCGNDGVTYQNACFANRAGMKIKKQGVCITQEDLIEQPLPEKTEGDFFFEGQFGAQIEDADIKNQVVEILGQVDPTENGLFISGVTEPNVLVTVYINEYIAFKTISDEQGNWFIEVLHEDISRDKGVEVNYVVDVSIKRLNGVEGIIPKESPRIQISQLNVLVPFEGTAEIVFEGGLKRLEVAQEDVEAWSDVLGRRRATDILTAIQVSKVVLEDTVALVENNEEDIRAGLAVSMPVVIVANPVIMLNLPHLPIYIYHAFSWILGVLGIRRKRRAWGVVYNSISKNPVALAVVRLFEIKQRGAEPVLIETQVTDKEGKFGFLPRVGNFYIDIVKNEYVFPTNILKGTKIDGEYENVYHKEKIFTRSLKDQLNLDIPVDPMNKRTTTIARVNTVKGFVVRLRKAAGYIGLPVLLVGTLFAAAVTAVEPSAINMILLGFYSVCLYMNYSLRPQTVRPWGIVYNIETKKPVELAVINVIDIKYNRLLKSRLTDYDGRFSFFPPSGEYKLTVNKEGYSFPVSNADIAKSKESLYSGETFMIDDKNKIINVDIPVIKAKKPIKKGENKKTVKKS